MNRSRLVTAAIFSLPVSTGLTRAADLPVPAGWHAVSPAAFASTEDNHFRVHLPAHGLEARSDFDGDGREDAARVLERDDHKSCALFLTYSASGHITHRKLENSDKACASGSGQSLYVVSEPASPKPILTWCGKGVACEAHDPKALHLKRSGIGFGFFEASYSIVFWDDRIRNWHTVLISD